jgi:hypothetical protein
MDESTTENALVTLKMKTPFDLMTNEEREKKIAEAEKKLAELERGQELIDDEFVYFEKCPIRYVTTKDDNGNELKGYKDKNGSTPEEHFNTCNKLTATQDILLYENIVGGAISAQPANQNRDRSVNIVNQVLADHEPRDSTEAKLCLQAHTLYSQGMRYLHLADIQDQIPQAEYHMKNAIKLLRLHNETVEALNRHRRKGEQKVIVQHVQVNDGGKAVIAGQMGGGG